MSECSSSIRQDGADAARPCEKPGDSAGGPGSHGVQVPATWFDAPLDLTQLFGRSAPVEVEIGCGKGGFLLARARACPDRDFLGIEWANKIAAYAADRMRRWGLGNVRVVRTDARTVFFRALSAGCLAALHTYHPDPWPKRRHARRRLFQTDFINAAVRTLAAGGRWMVQTDHAAYYEQIRALLTGHPELEVVPFDEADDGQAPSGPETNYEIKYRREGRTIYRLAVRKQGAAQPSCVIDARSSSATRDDA